MKRKVKREWLTINRYFVKIAIATSIVICYVDNGWQLIANSALLVSQVLAMEGFCILKKTGVHPQVVPWRSVALVPESTFSIIYKIYLHECKDLSDCNYNWLNWISCTFWNFACIKTSDSVDEFPLTVTAQLPPGAWRCYHPMQWLRTSAEVPTVNFRFQIKAEESHGRNIPHILQEA